MPLDSVNIPVIGRCCQSLRCTLGTDEGASGHRKRLAFSDAQLHGAGRFVIGMTGLYRQRRRYHRCYTARLNGVFVRRRVLQRAALQHATRDPAVISQQRQCVLNTPQMGSVADGSVKLRL